MDRRWFGGLPVKAAITFGSIHLLAFIAFAILVGKDAGEGGSEGAQWQMAWMLFWLLDWPISQLLTWDGWPSGTIAFLPYPFDNFRSFIFPCLFFGVLGTIWYAIIGFVIGSFVKGVFNLFSRKDQVLQTEQKTELLK